MPNNNNLSIFNPSAFIPEQTVSVRTFIKSAFTLALSEVYALIPDPVLQTTLDANGNKLSGVTVTVEYPTDLIVYPCIVIKWLEQFVRNIGVGHIENITDEYGNVWPFRHAHYQGQIEFGIYALSSLDRDLVADSLIQIMRMPDMAPYTLNYYNQIFNDTGPSRTLHYINVDTDNIRPVGESVGQVPWGSENELVYRGGYRANCTGEFYSLPPNFQPSGPVEEVLVFPYTPLDVLQGTVPDPDPTDPAFWQPPIPGLPGPI